MYPLRLKFKSLLEQLGDQKRARPAEAKALQRSKIRLRDNLSAHNSAMLMLAPNLWDVELNPSGERRLWASPITLPSSFTGPERQNLNLDALAAIEAELRIGHGHDVLEKLRKALGVRSFLAKKSRDRTNYRTHTHSQEEIRRAQLVVKQWGRIYRKNWAALSALDVKGAALRGLQELKDGDLTLLGAWLEDEQYRNPGVNLPWIWKLSPLIAEGGEGMDGDEVAGLVASWNDEGACKGCVLPFPSSF